MTIILNRTSGTASGDENFAKAIEEGLGPQGITATIWRAESGDDLPVLAKRAAEGSDDTIVAAGGDGTVHAVASALTGSSKRMGVLPLGTLNHFAKDLAIPMNVREAAEILATGVEKAVDLGEVNGRIFLNNSSIGFYPRIVRHRDEQRQRLRRGKWPAFAWAVLSALQVCPALRLKLRANGRETLARSPFLFIGNNVYLMDFLRIGSRERLDAGVLSVYFARGTGRREVIRLALRSLAGRLKQAENFEAFSAQELHVELRARRVDVSLDGELFRMESPLQYRIRPRALRVIVPRANAVP